MKKKSFHTFEEKKEKEINAAIDLFSSNSKFYNFIQKLNEKPWKIFYKGLLPKKIKKIIDKQADFYQQEYVEQCWDKIIGEYFKLKENEVKTPIDDIISKKKIDNQKIIWQYWGTGWENKELPDIVKLCMKSVEKYKGDYTIIRLDDNNLKKYIDLPQFILEKKKNGKIPFAFFSDLLRLSLLKCYGGVWLDATILLTNFLPKKYEYMDYFMFQRSINVKNKKYWEKMNNDYFSWNEKHKINVLNSIIFSKKENKVIKTILDLLLIFWEKKEKVPHYFFFQILYDKLINKHMTNIKCEIIDDTLPHILFSKWNDKFNEKEYIEITKNINMHKLTYKLVNEKNCKKNSFYDYFINIYRSI